jgi:hypothetical protein
MRLFSHIPQGVHAGGPFGEGLDFLVGLTFAP